MANPKKLSLVIFVLPIFCVVVFSAAFSQTLDDIISKPEIESEEPVDLPTSLPASVSEIIPGFIPPDVPGNSKGNSILQVLINLINQLFGTPPGVPNPIPPQIASATNPIPGTASGTTPSGNSLSEEDEKSFAERAKKFSGDKWKAIFMGGGGDTEAKRNIAEFGFADWFCELQQVLIERSKWGPEEEEAQQLLNEYATAQGKALNEGNLHSTLGYFNKYIGMSAYNNSAVRNYDSKLRRASDIGGDGANNIWCAYASRGSFQRGLAPEYSFIPGTPPAGQKSWGALGDWLNYGKGRKFLETQPKSRENLKQGDVITIADKSGKDKHVATVVGVKGDKVLIISGNAGGAPKGTVRMETVDLSRINHTERYSRLDKAKLNEMSDEELSKIGIRRKK